MSLFIKIKRHGRDTMPNDWLASMVFLITKGSLGRWLRAG